VRLIGERSQGFIYLVSVTGITGPRDHLPSDLAAFVQRVRVVTDKPLAVGFGISSLSQASRVAELADGVIVGSELLRRAQGEDGVKQVREFVAQLHSATIRGQQGER
jgi:tryptophan synthase alpha chain